jgi:hypothetical protein
MLQHVTSAPESWALLGKVVISLPYKVPDIVSELFDYMAADAFNVPQTSTHLKVISIVFSAPCSPALYCHASFCLNFHGCRRTLHLACSLTLTL